LLIWWQWLAIEMLHQVGMPFSSVVLVKSTIVAKSGQVASEAGLDRLLMSTACRKDLNECTGVVLIVAMP
jgi:hypothetical protein